jgi:hypothetical protein
MKKSWIIGLIGLACSATASFGQGTILLDNYNTGGPLVTYGGGGVPANGVSGTPGTVGTGLLAGWTFGFYYALGNVTGSIGSEGGGNWADPSTLGGGLALATGFGSTAAFCTIASGNTPGAALANRTFSVPGTSVDGGNTITLEMVAYSGSSYDNSSYRAHSAPFTMTTSANTSVIPHPVGSFMPAFSIIAIPEPSVWVFAGAGGFALIRFRRRT